MAAPTQPSLQYSVDSPYPGQYFYFTFSAGSNLGLTYKDASKYAYVEGSPVTLWIETEGPSVTGGQLVLTGDSIAIKASVPTSHYLDFKSEYDSYVHWSLAGVGSNAWQIFIDDAHTTGSPIPLGTPFTIWNATLNGALVVSDTSFCSVGQGTPWTFTAAAAS